MSRLSQVARLGVYSLLFLWFLIGFAFYRNMNLTVILPLFVLLVLYRLMTKGFKFWVPKQAIALLLFVGYYLMMSVLFFKTMPTMTNLVIRYLFLPVIAFYSSMTLVRSERVRLYFVACLKTLIAGSALFGIYEWLTRFNPLASFIKTGASEWIDRMNRYAHLVYYPSSFFTHYTYFAYVLLVGWVLALIYPSKYKFLDLLYKGTILFALIVSQSRMAWLTFLAVTIIYYLFFSKKVSLPWLVGTPVVALALYFSGLLEQLLSFVSERFSRIFALGFSDGSLGQRVGTFQNVWPYMEEHPFKAILGGGYASTVYDFLPKYSYFAGFQTTDSMATTYLIDTGILGAGLFLVGVVSYFRLLNLKQKSHQFLVLLLSATLMEMLFFDFFANNITLYLFFMIWGVMIPRFQTNDDSSLD